jgi:hypothetical protein
LTRRLPRVGGADYVLRKVWRFYTRKKRPPVLMPCFSFKMILNPVNVPLFPFLNATVVNMHDRISEEGLPDYVIVGNLIDDKGLWEIHPLYPRYQLVLNLVYRDSYTWFSRFRVGNLYPKWQRGSTSGANTDHHRRNCGDNSFAFYERPDLPCGGPI